MRPTWWWVLPLACWVLASCTGTRRVPQGQLLLVGHAVQLDSKEPAPPGLSSQLQAQMSPSPTPSVLGMRPRLWLHQRVAAPAQPSGFRHWLKNKVGKAPVYLADAQPQQVQQRMLGLLYSQGYFGAQVQPSAATRGRTARLRYQVQLPQPYRIDSIHWFAGVGGQLGQQLASPALRQGSLLQPGQAYATAIFASERQRIASALREVGYYYFEPDLIEYEVDTSLRRQACTVRVGLAPGLPDSLLQPYTIGRITINPFYVLGNDSLQLATDTLKRLGWTMQNYDYSVRVRTFQRSIFLADSMPYRAFDHEKTLNKLSGLNLYKYVNIDFRPADSNQLDAVVLLSPLRKKSISTEVLLATKSNNFTGPALRLNWKNRNLLRGAELLELRLNAGYETVLSGQNTGLNSYEVGLDAQVDVPRFLLPITVRGQSKEFLPYTRFRTGVDVLNRVQFYRLNSLQFDYGYAWRETKRKSHVLNPISINYTRLAEIFPEFQALLDANALLRRSFEQQFILGASYSFTYSDQGEPGLRNHFYFNSLVDVSGHLARLGSQVFSGRAATAENPYTIAGLPFAQYAKVQLDARYYLPVRQRSQLANRLILGAGYAYGNSTTLPFIKQFFIGGNNSLRAFRIRSLGPGTYRSPDSLANSNFFDQTGDLKLEANSELRFPIIGYFKGALFVDVGNVWLLRQQDERPGGEFIPSQFLGQLAVGSGFGLRIDVQFFVFRLDLGLALRRPYRPAGQRWVFGDYELTPRSLLSENAVLNLAIGYPF